MLESIKESREGVREEGGSKNWVKGERRMLEWIREQGRAWKEEKCLENRG